MGAEAFATLADLRLRCPSLSEEDEPYAAALLADATACIASGMRDRGVAIDQGDEVQAANLRSVCVAMVKRALPRDGSAPGASQMTTTAGPYSETFSFANPLGDLYMTSAEESLLGLGRQRIGSTMPTWGGDGS